MSKQPAKNRTELGKSYSYSYSSSSSNTTTSKNGKPVTVTETSHSTHTNDDGAASGFPGFSPYFNDGFEELKRSVLSGDAYKYGIDDIKVKAGFPHYKPQEGGSTVITPIRAQMSHSVSRTTSNSGSGGSAANSPPPRSPAASTGTGQASPPLSDSGAQSTPPKTMNWYKTELAIPVRRYHDTFDNFFWDRMGTTQHGSSMDAEMAQRRREWEHKLDQLKKDFFHFSPFTGESGMSVVDSSRTLQSPATRGPVNGRQDGNNNVSVVPRSKCNAFKKYSAKRSMTTTTTTKTTTTRKPTLPPPPPPPVSLHVTIPPQPGLCYGSLSSPSGRPEFAVQFDCKDFKPEEVKVSTKDGKLLITANHEEKSGGSTSRREFTRTVDLPKDIQIGLMRSVLSRDGILSVTAPIQPPNYQPTITSGAGEHNSSSASNSQVTQQYATALSSAPTHGGHGGQVVSRGADSHDALNYNMSIEGYRPEEVSVTVEGRKVKVHAKHDEVARGKKTHNEMTKSFDLPPSVDPHKVRSYISNNTLYIECHLKTDLAGKIHLVPVTHK